MKEIEFFQSKQKVFIPSNWEEMTDAQIRFVFKCYYECIEQGASLLEFNIRVLFHLLDIDDAKKYLSLSRHQPVTAQKISENIHWLCANCLDFLFTDEEGKTAPSLSYNSIHNPLPEINAGFTKNLIGPSDILADLTFAEFRHASSALNSFFQSRDIADLNECIAHLYRPKAKKTNKAGRKVLSVRQETFSKDVAVVAKLPTWEKTLIMMFFSNCINYLQNGSLVIDGETVDFAKLYSGGSGSSDFGFGWNDLLVQIAREGVIGNIDSVGEEPLMNILSIMWTNYKENRRYETRNK